MNADTIVFLNGLELPNASLRKKVRAGAFAAIRSERYQLEGLQMKVCRGPMVLVASRLYPIAQVHLKYPYVRYPPIGITVDSHCPGSCIENYFSLSSLQISVAYYS